MDGEKKTSKAWRTKDGGKTAASMRGDPHPPHVIDKHFRAENDVRETASLRESSWEMNISVGEI